ncbi:MAG: YbhB/YbcL family Raf kinase inhibitor-like protein [Rhodocyclaceae bacterium]|nr:YbhB/YbcL family Raf kinase inhibitor-like protein [Rhodocyclaceae bacterium]
MAYDRRLALPLLFALTVAAPAVQAGGFTLSSPDLGPKAPIANKHVFKGFGCEGENVSPALAWSGAPKDTKSFALMVYDPDAPTGSGWWHWVMFNIPADAKELPQGAGDPAAGKAPKGAVQSRTDFGKPGWGGPCPPVGHGPHRYIFTLHALKTDKLDLPEDASAALVGYMVNANRIGKASFTAKYERRKP